MFKIISITTIALVIQVIVVVQSDVDYSHCSHAYANDVASILGQEYYNVIKDTLKAQSESFITSSQNQRAKKNKLIINIGPGTSGTRSLYIAATQLNFTAFHSGSSSCNCTSYNRNDVINFDPLFNISTMEIMNKASSNYILWGDVPAPNHWWRILHQFHSESIFIMTDVNDEAWFRTRRKKNSMKPVTYEWTVPIAFHPRDLHFTDRKLTWQQQASIIETMLLKLNIWHVSEDTNRLYFEAYRRFARCAIPFKKLLWLRMSEEKSPTFWKKLVDFVGVDVSNDKMDMLIDGGVPYWGSIGCYIGKSHSCMHNSNGVSNPFPNLCS